MSRSGLCCLAVKIKCLGKLCRMKSCLLYCSSHLALCKVAKNEMVTKGVIRQGQVCVS